MLGIQQPALELLPKHLVFQDPLVHAREAGFATPTLSPPVALACVPELDRMEMVDMVRKTWNTLEGLVRLHRHGATRPACAQPSRHTWSDGVPRSCVSAARRGAQAEAEGQQ